MQARFLCQFASRRLLFAGPQGLAGAYDWAGRPLDLSCEHTVDLDKGLLLVQSQCSRYAFDFFTEGARFFHTRLAQCLAKAERARPAYRLRDALRGTVTPTFDFLKQAVDLPVSDPPDIFDEVPPRFQSLAVWIYGRQAHLIWCGGQQAFLTSDQAPLYSIPHTVPYRVLKEGGPDNPLANLNPLLKQWTSQGSNFPSHAHWTLPDQGELSLVCYQFPKALGLAHVTQLEGLNAAQGVQWCQRNDFSYYCILRCRWG